MNRVMICLDFHRLEWSDRSLRKYYIRLVDGTTYYRWASDVVDAVDSVRGHANETDNYICAYGNVVEAGR